MLELPDPRSIARVADWAELVIAISNEPLSKALVSSNIEGASGVEPAEDFLSSVWRELSYRQSLYSSPFFSVEGRSVESRSNGQAPIEYQACLILSLYGVQGNTQLPGKLFERLTKEAVKRYLSGEAVVFGWPFEDGGDISSNEAQITRMIKKAANDLHERFIESPPPQYKDRGVDVIGWIPFKEKRSGQVVILLQSAAGHDWKKKNQVPLHNWVKYIHWGCDPIKAFAVPCIVDERDWHEKSWEKGILFDRVRILNLLPNGVEDAPLQEEMRLWVKEQLTDFDSE